MGALGDWLHCFWFPGVLSFECIVLSYGLPARLSAFLRGHHWRSLGIDTRKLELRHLLILSVCLMVMGWLLGYLAEQHKRLQAEVERASIARNLHDGTLQSLLGLKMRLHVLSASQEGSAAQELREIQQVLLEEARKLRELMQQVKPVDVDAASLRPHLIEVTQRFERETGIRAQFGADSSDVDIERSACGVVVRIVQEALANVRKHSCATDVWVRLDRRDSNWQLPIEDDGIGFPFAGRFSQSELKASGRGPLVILECVDSIRGELVLESKPRRGSRLEITIPPKWRAMQYG